MKTAFFTLCAMCVAVNLAKAETPVDPMTEAPIDPMGEAPIQFVDRMYAAMVVTTVEGALTMPDKGFVLLTGKIINNLGDKKYTFKDDTGEVVVVIDDEYLKDVNVTPESKVEIIGEIDKETTGKFMLIVKSFALR